MADEIAQAQDVHQGQRTIFNQPVMERLFSDEFFRYLSSIIESPFALQMAEEVRWSKRLSYGAKEALIRILITYFDRNVILSHLKDVDVEIQLLKMNVSLETARSSMNPNDVSLPEIEDIMQQIYDNYAFQLTRTVGTDRERRMQKGSTSVDLAPQQPERAQRGWGLSKIIGGGD